MYHAQTCAVFLVLVSLLGVNCMETNMTTMDTPEATTDTPEATTTKVVNLKNDYEDIYKLLKNTTLTTSELLEAIKKDDKYGDFKQELYGGKDLTETQLESLVADVKAELNPENGCIRNHVAIGSVVLVTVMSMFVIN